MQTNIAEKKTTDLIEFSATEASLALLEDKYTEVPDADTKDGYTLIVAALSELRPLRTGLDKMRKSLNADDQERINARNTEAKRITARLLDLESPFREAKVAQDNKAARLEEEKKQAEIKRTSEIRKRIESIRGMGEGLISADAQTLKKRLQFFLSVEIDDSFAEFKDHAQELVDNMARKIAEALNERLAFEAEQNKLTKQRQAQEQQQAAIDAKMREIEQTEERPGQANNNGLQQEMDKRPAPPVPNIRAGTLSREKDPAEIEPADCHTPADEKRIEEIKEDLFYEWWEKATWSQVLDESESARHEIELHWPTHKYYPDRLIKRLMNYCRESKDTELEEKAQEQLRDE